MASSPHVVVLGSIMQDLTFACAHFPREGQTVMAQLKSGQGGKGSNQAIACGRLGVSTIFVGATGRDQFSKQVVSFYRREKIGCRLVAKPRQATGTAVILVNSAGENQIVIEPGANAKLDREDVPARLLMKAKVVLTQLESNQATTAHALKTARLAGALTILNPAPMRDDFDSSLLGHVDILIPNESEFVALVRRHPSIRQIGFTEGRLLKKSGAAMHSLCRKIGVPTIIVTLGSRGCFVSKVDGYHALPAHEGIKVVDSTGAGDAFCGGFAAGLLRCEGDIIEAARFGTAVAALSITKPGAAFAMPRLAQVIRLMRRADPPKIKGAL